MARLFGTDGVRGVANREVTAELALGLSVAAARVLGGDHVAGDRPAGAERAKAVVGRDPRASGEFLSAAVMAGLASAGVDVLDAGVLPTPAIAFLTATSGAGFGVMLSASHNAMPDNGIKFFAKGGHKLPDAVEDEIEAALGTAWERPTGAGVGRIRTYDDGLAVYVAHLERALPHPLTGLRVVFDAAHGAAYQAGPTAFRQAGAKVEVIGGEPDGWNINDGYGSTHLTRLQHAVVRHGADLGIAVDGDADRCLAVDAQGRVVDGDQILSVLSLALRERGQLKDDTVVATVMSNLGMLVGLRREGITVRQTAVGDRYVLEEMNAGGFSLGGEQSGHVILPEHSTTGDGVLTGLMLASRVAETGRTLAHLASVMSRMPQVLVNVKGVDKSRVQADEDVQEAVRTAERHLGDRGRVLLRSSGTEPLVRVMVEADEAGWAQSVAEDLAAVVRRRLALELESVPEAEAGV